MKEIYEILTSAFGSGEKGGEAGKDGILFYCPFCPTRHPKPHLSINIQKFAGHCWVCGESGSIYHLLKKAGKHDLAREISGKKESKTTIENISEAFSCKKEIKRKPSIPESFKQLYKKQFVESYNPAFSYLFSRKLTLEDILTYNIHYSISENKILIPSYNANYELNYYVIRSLNDDGIKYINFSADKSSIVFNEWRIDYNSDLYIVEGIFDYITLRKNSVPLLGSSLNEKSLLFTSILKNNTPVILCLDPDANMKSIKMANMFYRYNINIKYVDWKENKQDISDLGYELACRFIDHNLIRFDLKNKIFKALYS